MPRVTTPLTPGRRFTWLVRPTAVLWDRDRRGRPVRRPDRCGPLKWNRSAIVVARRRDLRRSVVLRRALLGFATLCRALSGFVELC